LKQFKIDVEGSLVIRAPKKQIKEATIKGKMEKKINNFVMKKYPRALMRLNASMSMN